MNSAMRKTQQTRATLRKEMGCDEDPNCQNEDNKHFFNMLRRQPQHAKSSYNLRKKLPKKLTNSEEFASIESDEILKSSNSLYKFVKAVKQESKKSKNSSKIENRLPKPESSTSSAKVFSWEELLKAMSSMSPQRPPETKLKRKFEAVKSTTISSDGEHSDDSIIEITSKKIDSNVNKSPKDQKTAAQFELLKQLNSEFMQENNKFMTPAMLPSSFINYPSISPLAFNPQPSIFPSIKALSFNQNPYFNTFPTLPPFINQGFGSLPYWNNFQNPMKWAKMGMIGQQQYNLSRLMDLFQQNGASL